PTSPDYLPRRGADAEGYFEREGLTVVLKTTRAEVGAAEALAQGQVDLAATSLEAILRFGPRQPRQMSKLVLGLTAAPPVALLTTRNLEGTLTSVKNLVGLRIGVATPGAPEHAWLNAILARAGVPLMRVDLVSLGTRGLVTGLDTGDVQAGVGGAPDEFSRRLNTTREIFLPNGTVTPAQLTETVDIVRAYGPLPATLKMPKPEEFIHRSALKRRSP